MLKVALIHPFSIILGLFVFDSCFPRPFQSSINMYSKRILSELIFLASVTSVTTDWLLEPVMVMRLVSGSTGLSWSAEECGALAASVSRDDNNNSAALVTASLPSLLRPGEFRSRRRPPSSPRPVLFRSGGLVTARCG